MLRSKTYLIFDVNVSFQLIVYQQGGSMLSLTISLWRRTCFGTCVVRFQVKIEPSEGETQARGNKRHIRGPWFELPLFVIERERNGRSNSNCFAAIKSNLTKKGKKVNQERWFTNLSWHQSGDKPDLLEIHTGLEEQEEDSVYTHTFHSTFTLLHRTTGAWMIYGNCSRGQLNHNTYENWPVLWNKSAHLMVWFLSKSNKKHRVPQRANTRWPLAFGQRYIPHPIPHSLTLCLTKDCRLILISRHEL